MKYVRMVLVCAAIAVGLLGFAYTSRAQQASDASYQAMSDKFFTFLQQGKGSDAVDYLLGTNPAMKKVPDQVENLKAQFASLGPLMGSYVSHTELAETKVAGMYIYQHYFVAYERQPISIRIQYYKPGTAWLCYGVQFDANLTDLIKTQVDSRIPIEAK
ncbi:MAG: hypothetical protein WBQ43_18075 [Terriglobales bacterium]